MSVFMGVVAVSGTVMDHVLELEHFGSFAVCQVSWFSHGNIV